MQKYGRANGGQVEIRSKGAGRRGAHPRFAKPAPDFLATFAAELVLITLLFALKQSSQFRFAEPVSRCVLRCSGFAQWGSAPPSDCSGAASCAINRTIRRLFVYNITVYLKDLCITDYIIPSTYFVGGSAVVYQVEALLGIERKSGV